jgi:hypothetical protein
MKTRPRPLRTERRRQEHKANKLRRAGNVASRDAIRRRNLTEEQRQKEDETGIKIPAPGLTDKFISKKNKERSRGKTS